VRRDRIRKILRSGKGPKQKGKNETPKVDTRTTIPRSGAIARCAPITRLLPGLLARPLQIVLVVQALPEVVPILVVIIIGRILDVHRVHHFRRPLRIKSHEVITPCPFAG
jgi:hypothetical protein